MIGKLFFIAIIILIVFHTNVSANSSNASPDSKKTALDSKTTDLPCLNPHYEYKKFRPETEKDLPFPPGAIVVVSKCMDERVDGKISSEEKLQQAKIDKEKAVKKLSFLLSYIYYQQNNLAGSYKKTDRAYDDLTQKKDSNAKAYDRAVTNYENTLKSYGEYRAYLSALPKAVSEYEQKSGSSIKEFALQNEDGIITMTKTIVFAQAPGSLAGAGAKVNDSTENNSDIKDKKEARKNLCMLAGSLGGIPVAESIFLATLSNPLSAMLGASLGSALCSENFYEKMTLFPRNFKAKVVDMGAYIKEGLEEIGTGLYTIGKKYLYVSPSKTGEKIAEHFKNAKSWMNRKLGWQ